MISVINGMLEKKGIEVPQDELNWLIEEAVQIMNVELKNGKSNGEG